MIFLALAYIEYMGYISYIVMQDNGIQEGNCSMEVTNDTLGGHEAGEWLSHRRRAYC